MQFGQLLTHLDTTQQMINNTLKDNNTLLAQVGSPASRLEHRWFRSQMTLQWQYNRGFWEGLGVMASAQMGNSKFWRMSLVRSVGLKQTEKSDLVTRHPFTLTYFIGVNRLHQLSLFLVKFHFLSPQVQQTMKENLHAIEENFSALDERMKKVSK